MLALFLLEGGYMQAKPSPKQFFFQSLNDDLAQISREGLASKYLRQGGGQNCREGWLSVKAKKSGR